MNQPQSSNPAEMYQRYFVPAMFLPWSRLLLRQAALQPGERVLDVACGTGIVAREAAALAGAQGQIVALDMNPAMLAVARALPAVTGAAIDWQEGNATAMPFPDGSFEVVLCQHGLQLIPDREGVAREMRRVLAPGGRVLVMVLQALSLHPVFEALNEAVARQLAMPVAAVAAPFSLFDADELRNLFSAAGFGSVEVVPVSTTVHFPEPGRFVPLAVTSSAAAVPAFARLEAEARATLFETIRQEVAATLQKYTDGEVVSFPMFAHIAVASA